jgi:hypothetical protein
MDIGLGNEENEESGKPPETREAEHTLPRLEPEIPSDRQPDPSCGRVSDISLLPC